MEESSKKIHSYCVNVQSILVILFDTKNVWWWFRNRLRSTNSLFFFNLQIEVNIRFSLVLGTKNFIFFIDIKNKLLDMTASNLVLIIVSRADCYIKRLARIFLRSTFQSKFDLFRLIISGRVLVAQFNYSFHVASFGSYQTSRYLKLSFVVYLNVKTASVLNLILALLF